MTSSMRRALLLAPLAFLLLIIACPLGPKDGDEEPEPADGDSGEADARPPSWIPVIPATEVKAPATPPDPKPVPAEDVEAPAGPA